MNIKIQKKIEDYIQWLRQGITTREVNGYTEITTPFLDKNNDYLQLYIHQEDDKYIISDDGYTINDLMLSGFNFNTKQRKLLRDQILNVHGVSITKNNALVITVNDANFPQRKHDLIQAILQINDLCNVSESNVASMFYEDVLTWLDENGVRYTQNANFHGKSGFNHAFDFIIPRSNKFPERFVRAINKPSRDKAESFVFAWGDIKGKRAANSKAYAILNDKEKVPSQIIEALNSYEISTILWKERGIHKESLAA